MISYPEYTTKLPTTDIIRQMFRKLMAVLFVYKYPQCNQYVHFRNINDDARDKAILAFMFDIVVFCHVGITVII